MAGLSTTPSIESDWGTGRMDLLYVSSELPKEDLQLIFRRLHSLSKDARHFLLAQFISEATRSIKDEIRELPTQSRELFPPFETVLDWVEFTELRKGALCGAVDGTLLVVAQICRGSPTEAEGYDPALTGLGVGLLSSIAASLSSIPGDVPLAGGDAARLALRMGIHVQTVSASLEERGSKPETWAYVVYNVDEATTQKELDAAQSREELPPTDSIFISAVSRSSVTVSGPPARLMQLFNVKSRFFRNSRSIALPVHGGMCHATHVYGLEDVRKIVQDCTSPLHTVAASRHVVLPVYSTSTGRPYAARSALELLEAVISELLTKAIRWDDVVAGFVSALQVNPVSEVVLHSFGHSVPLSDLTGSIGVNLPEYKLGFNNFTTWMIEKSAGHLQPRGTAQAKLAIVGMSCRMPGGATNTEKFWEILEQGLDVSRRIPADRFDIDTHYDSTGKDLNKSMTQYGCFIDDPGMFDGPLFNMSSREAQVVDPQMRLALVTAFEALERSGYVGNRTVSTKLQLIGPYYGQAADDCREVNQGQEVSTYYIPGGCRAFGPGRNYFFKFAGPSYSIDTACSSGLASIEVACQALWNGDVDMAVAGGVNILTNPDGFAGLCNGHFLTKGHNACKSWDASADGYCRADGIGSVVIKRLEDAEADNDNILAVVLAAGTNHSAEAVLITHPHAGHQSYLSRQVLRQAGVDPLDVSYIELHGTGTQAGDFEEMSGILDVYAPLTKRRSEGQALHIGSVKSNVGHSESAPGTTALNLPIGVPTVVLILLFFHVPKHIQPTPASWKEILRQLDLPGYFLFLASLTVFTQAVQWGGQSRPWNDGAVIALLVVWLALTLGFIAWEWSQGQYAMIPLANLKPRMFWTNALYGWLVNLADFQVLFYLPIYFQSIHGQSAIISGVNTIPFVTLFAVGSVVSGTIASKTGHLQPLQLASGLLATAGAALMYTLDVNSSVARYIGPQLLLGFGIGLGNQIPMTAYQFFSAPAEVQTNTGIMLMTNGLSGACFVTAATTIWANRMLQQVAVLAPEISTTLVLQTGASEVAKVWTGSDLIAVREGYMTGIRGVFAFSIAGAASTAVLACFIPRQRLPGHAAVQSESSGEAEEKVDL